MRSPQKHDATSPRVPDFASAPHFIKRDSHAKCIPRVPHRTACRSAANFAKLFLTNEVLDCHVGFTNVAATEHPRLSSQARLHNWKPVTNDKMMMFICICSYLGVVKLHKVCSSKTREKADGFLQALPFKLGDSKRVATKRHEDCAFGKRGNTGPGTKWLLFCQQCDRGYHSHCTIWTLARNHAGAEIYICRPCLDTHEQTCLCVRQDH